MSASDARWGSDLLLATILIEHGERRPEVSRPLVRAIIAHAERLAGAPPGTITGRARKREIVHLRRAVAKVASAYPYSLCQIGAAMDGRDHSSVIHLIRTAEDYCARDPEFARFVEQLWTAVECAPFGPGRVAPVPVEIAPEVSPVIADAEEPDEAANAKPDAEETEYKERGTAMERGSGALLNALRREHPSRVPARAAFLAPRPTLRSGYGTLGAA